MAVEDSLPIPRYGEPYAVYFPVFHETGIVQHVEGVTATVSVDRGPFITSTNSVTDIHESGYFYIELTEEEMTGRVVIIQPDPNDADYRTPPIILYPEQPGDMRTHTLTIEDPVSGEIAVAVLGNLPTKLVIVSPVVEGGNLLLVKGDDYLNVDGRALTWTENSGTWPDLSEAAVHLIIGDRRFFRKEITVTTPTGNPKALRAELTRVETAKFTQASYPFVVEATMETGSRVTLIKGYVRTTAGI
jgi:hypothetical protein